jgi:hypothetical protein
MPSGLRTQAGALLETARTKGDLLDSKWALEVAGIVQHARLESMIRDGLASDSQWIRDTAYRQAARMPRLSEDIARAMRVALIRLAGRGILLRDRVTIRAFLSRFDPQHKLLQVELFLSWLPLCDATAIALGFAVFVSGSPTPLPWVFLASITLVLINLRLLFWYMQGMIPSQWFWQFRTFTFFLLVFVPGSYFSTRGHANHTSADLWAILRGDSMPFLPSLSSLKQSIMELGQAQNIKSGISSLARAALWLGPLWSLLALVAVEDGKLLQPFWWPLMPFVVLMRRLKNWRQVARMSAKVDRKSVV